MAEDKISRVDKCVADLHISIAHRDPRDFIGSMGGIIPSCGCVKVKAGHTAEVILLTEQSARLRRGRQVSPGITFSYLSLAHWLNARLQVTNGPAELGRTPSLWWRWLVDARLHQPLSQE